ncbi:MAG: hypothetical protein JWR15_3597, partial [Prosthecobacter sp.]|nr:hypothetical protein [Prosthecobacter sp.]
MKTSLLLCLAVLLTAPLARAADKAVDFPKESPRLTFVLPDSWAVKFEEDSLIATPTKDDDSVSIQVDEMAAGL